MKQQFISLLISEYCPPLWHVYWLCKYYNELEENPLIFYGYIYVYNLDILRIICNDWWGRTIKSRIWITKLLLFHRHSIVILWASLASNRIDGISDTAFNLFPLAEWKGWWRAKNFIVRNCIHVTFLQLPPQMQIVAKSKNIMTFYLEGKVSALKQTKRSSACRNKPYVVFLGIRDLLKVEPRWPFLISIGHSFG